MDLESNVLDTVTGLDWLDLTETNNLSYIGSGSSFEGFRYSTNDEVVVLWHIWNIDLSAFLVCRSSDCFIVISIAISIIGTFVVWSFPQIFTLIDIRLPRVIFEYSKISPD